MSNSFFNQQWQPIETAPKDGEMIIGLFNGWAGDSVSITWYNKITTSRRFGKTIIRTRKGWHNGSSEITPTHWIPLPKLPTQ